MSVIVALSFASIGCSARESDSKTDAELRRLPNEEVTPALSRRAQVILDQHNDSEIGTEVPFKVGGRHYVARIEEHYHPEGGPRKPWGYHKGISLFAVEEEEQTRAAR
jgi:hypothetical protein